MQKVVLGLSGGMDSATLCGYYLDQGYQVVPVSFEYGSKHNQYERKAAEELAKFYDLKIIKLSLPFIGELFSSNLLKSGGGVPEGYYTDSNMNQTVVPGRNVIFISIMMGLAWSVGANVVAIGAHAGDHTIYEDCRPSFILPMADAVRCGSGDRVVLQAPFLYLDKTEILKIGYGLKPSVPYELTRTCYKDQELSCGRCGACQERTESFRNLKVVDPIKYEGEKSE